MRVVRRVGYTLDGLAVRALEIVSKMSKKLGMNANMCVCDVNVWEQKGEDVQASPNRSLSTTGGRFDVLAGLPEDRVPDRMGVWVNAHYPPPRGRLSNKFWQEPKSDPLRPRRGGGGNSPSDVLRLTGRGR